MYGVLNYPLDTEGGFQLSSKAMVSVFLAAVTVALGIMGVSYLDGVTTSQLAMP